MMANRNSASASEIVTGALQDHDRAYVVGETTFGKALVQSVYRISGGAGLALTTAHYYTPSGRLIQRPWDATFDEYLSYTLRDQDADAPHNAERSEAHRRRPSGLQRRRHRARQADRRTASKASTRRASAACCTAGRSSRTTRRSSRADGDTRIAPATSTGRKTVKPNFVVDDAMVADFREQLEDRQGQDRRRRVQEGRRFHQGDDPLRDRRGRVRHRRRAAPSDRASIRRRRWRSAEFGEAQKLTRAREGAHQGRAVGCTVGIVRLRRSYDHNRLVAVVCPCHYS